jgi:glycosyltransferase involved in cell wall biosynthesis
MIDILLAAYNGEAYIESQINSILEQTESGFRLLIRDDGSTDGTRDLVEQIIARQGKPSRIQLLTEHEASGSSRNNFIRLLQHATGDYVMFSDQDDIWEPEKIAASMKLMKQAERQYGKENPLLVHTDLSVMAEDGSIVSDSLIDYMKLPRRDTLKNLLLQNSVTGCTILMNRPAAELLKLADEQGDFVIHDHFAAVLIALFGQVLCLPRPMVRYRQHGNNVIGASNANSLSYRMNRLKRGRRKFRQDMEDGYRQAAYILEHYKDRLQEAPRERRRLVEGYAGLLHANSRIRRRFFREHNMYKRGTLKKIMQILWC